MRQPDSEQRNLIDMFGIDITIIAFMVLAALGFGGIIYAFMFDSVANEAKQAKRLNKIKQRDIVKSTKAAAAYE